jgi:hypothetical protein
VANPIERLDDFLISYRTRCYGLIPSFVLNALMCLVALALGAFADFAWRLSGIGKAAAIFYCAYTIVFLALAYTRRKRLNPHRGHFLKKESIARRFASRLLAAHHQGERGVLWGNLRIPTEDIEKMFMVVGNIGSGKTLTFRLLMADQLPLLRPGSDRRALIYDSKQDCVQILAGMRLSCPMFILNPLDERHVAWDIARDIDDNFAASTFAAHLFPDNPHASTKFFDDAPRSIAAAVLQAFIDIAPGKWTLRHLVLVLQSEDLIRLIASKNPLSWQRVHKYLKGDNPRERASILSSIDSKISKFMEIAACWDSANKRISIRDWLDPRSSIGNAILVLGNYEPARTEIDLANQLFVDIVRKYSMALSESRERLTWLFLDEFPEAGKFDGFKSLVLRGRSKRIISVIGLQDVSTLYSIYGREETDGFLPQIGNRAYLHLKSHNNARWASDSINRFAPDFDAVEEGDEYRDAVPPQYFQKLPEADLTSAGLHGLYMNGHVGIWEAHYSAEQLRTLLPRPEKSVPPFKLIDKARTKLKPWSREDAELFGVRFDADDQRSAPLNAHVAPTSEGSDPLDQVGRFKL